MRAASCPRGVRRSAADGGDAADDGAATATGDNWGRARSPTAEGVPHSATAAARSGSTPTKQQQRPMAATSLPSSPTSASKGLYGVVSTCPTSHAGTRDISSHWPPPLPGPFPIMQPILPFGWNSLWKSSAFNSKHIIHSFKGKPASTAPMFMAVTCPSPLTTCTDRHIWHSYLLSSNTLCSLACWVRRPRASSTTSTPTLRCDGMAVGLFQMQRFHDTGSRLRISNKPRPSNFFLHTFLWYARTHAQNTAD